MGPSAYHVRAYPRRDGWNATIDAMANGRARRTAHVTDAYDVAADMLTRASLDTDTAPDVSVFPRARDPETGGRRLEELAFEVVDTQKLGAAAKKARLLSNRGVRRVFAVDLKKKRALEWSRPTNGWKMLPADGTIADPALVMPLPIDAIVVAAKADDRVRPPSTPHPGDRRTRDAHPRHEGRHDRFITTSPRSKGQGSYWTQR
jgi:hypothetical protein